MRAIQIEQFGDPAQVIRVVDIEEPPPPGPHEVLVSVEVSPLNKHDLLVVSGMLAQPPLPHIPGAEGVARVLATGPEVDELQVGDLVVLPLYAGASCPPTACSHSPPATSSSTRCWAATPRQQG
jgi:NADPH:quinone reductase-like Zn-dependent oxidoreductase